jgi:small nuclear ribonucleoprotein (snRNP)-like protein
MSGYVLMMRSLLGKRVEVTLTDSNEKPRVIVTGTLIAFDEMGEVVIQDDSGDPHWCWPNLKIEEIA